MTTKSSACIVTSKQRSAIYSNEVAPIRATTWKVVIQGAGALKTGRHFSVNQLEVAQRIGALCTSTDVCHLGEFFGQNEWIMQHFIIHYGYIGLFFFAIIESGCIPLPTEVALPLAGALCSASYVASSGDKPLNLFSVIAVVVVGELCGSLITYAIGRTGGRALVDRWGKYILLSHKDLDTAEHLFERRGAIVMLIARVLPTLRCFISFGAGIAEMPVAPMALFSFLGSVVWVTAWTYLGYHFSSTYEHFTKNFKYASYVLVAIVVVVLVAGFVHRYKSMKKHNELPTRGKHQKR